MPGHWKIVFTWILDDRELSAHGEGAARVASPDSARLDSVFYFQNVPYRWLPLLKEKVKHPLQEK